MTLYRDPRDLVAPAVLCVGERHHVTLARSEARRLAVTAGLGEPAAWAVAIAVSELAQNIVQHANGPGTVTVRPIRDRARQGLEIVVEDHGPGIADVARALEDDFSTAGGLGSGLPAARRLMDEFEIVSEPGKGTRVTARKWRR